MSPFVFDFIVEVDTVGDNAGDTAKTGGMSLEFKSKVFDEGAGGSSGDALFILPFLRPFLRFRILFFPLLNFGVEFTFGDPENSKTFCFNLLPRQ